MPSFVFILPSPRGHYTNVLSLFFINTPKDVSFLQMAYALSLFGLQHPHLILQGLHLLIELHEAPLDVVEPMHLSHEESVSHTCKCVVDARHIGVVKTE